LILYKPTKKHCCFTIFLDFFEKFSFVNEIVGFHSCLVLGWELDQAVFYSFTTNYFLLHHTYIIPSNMNDDSDIDEEGYGSGNEIAE
jgi:hypothetical protein